MPSNPRTGDQMVIRSNLAAQAAAYDALTEAQQNAWIAAAALEDTKPTLGQSGPLTGLQLFTKINCALLAIGGTPVTSPPAKPVIDPLPITSLEITNAASVIGLKLVAPGSPPEGTMLWGAAPQKSGVRATPQMKLLGTLDSPAAGKIDIKTPYTNQFGTPAVGQRVFVKVNACVDGWEGVPVVFTAIVPASS